MLKQNFENLSEQELKQRLAKTTAIFIGFGLVMLLIFGVFGTQVGALFGFISKNRNDNGNTFKQAVTPPVFTEIPKAIKGDKTNIKGFANSGNTIKLFVNGPEKATTTSDQNGEFTFTDIEMIKGRNSVFAKATDAEGNESEKSETFTILYDDDRPEIEISSPKKDDVVKNLNSRVEIKGKVNEKVTITINEKYVAQKPDYSFDYLLGVQEGNVEIKIKAVDEAGNEKEEVFTVVYQKKAN